MKKLEFQQLIKEEFIRHNKNMKNIWASLDHDDGYIQYMTDIVEILRKALIDYNYPELYNIIKKYQFDVIHGFESGIDIEELADHIIQKEKK